MNNLISVIIPVYNTQKKYLDECVYSVLRQDYKNVEIIIVDDGSRADVAKCCDEYMMEDARVRVIHKKNEGVSVARNVGIEKAKGKWVFFLDSDDFIEKDSFQNIDKYFEYDTIMFKRIIFNKEEKIISDFEYQETVNFSQEQDFSKIIKKVLINNDSTSSMGMAISKLYKLDFLKKYNIKFLKGIPFREDTLFNINVFENITKMEFVNKAIYNYRVNSDSVTHKKDEKCVENSEKLITACKKMLNDKYLEEYYAFVIWQLNYVLIKNVFSEKTPYKNILIRDILKYDEYKKAIKNVKIRLLSKRKKVLIILLRCKCYFLLSFLYIK